MDEEPSTVEQDSAVSETPEHRARKIHITTRLERDLLVRIEELRSTYKIEGWEENPYFKKTRTFVINDLLRRILEN